MTKIGLISDVHATVAPIDDALAIFQREGVDQIYCLGDIAGYNEDLAPSIQSLQNSGCISIVGNHDQTYLEKYDTQTAAELSAEALSYLQDLPAKLELQIDGIRIYMVHAEPPDGCHGGIKLLDKHGELIDQQVEHWSESLQDFDYDILIVGHTHQVYTELLGSTLVINPGSTAFNNSCMILHLPEKRVEIFPLCGKPVEKTWNWGEHVIYAHRH